MGGQRDPVANFENYLLQFDIANEQFIQQTRDEIKQLIDDEWKIAFAADEIKPDPAEELGDLYAPKLAIENKNLNQKSLIVQ